MSDSDNSAPDLSDAGDTAQSFFDSRDDRLAAFGDCLADSASEAPAIEDRYEIRTELGAGGSKVVVEAYDRLSNRLVALAKARNPQDERSRAAFLHEARITATLQHPNVMPVYDLALEPEPYFTMRLGSDLTFRDHLPGKPAFNSLEANLEVFLKVCDAVSHAHSQGILHLDLKPDNVQVGELGDVLLSDWGLARRLDEVATTIGSDPREIAGTPGFLAPEQTDPRCGVLDERTDVYALGALLYAILCGHPPLSGSNLDHLVEKIRTGSFPAPSQAHDRTPIPPALEAVAMRALETAPTDRYQTVVALSNEIERFRGGFATIAENASFGQHFLLLVQRHKGVCAAIAAGLLISTITVAGFVRALQEREATAVAARDEAEQARAIAEAALEDARRERATTQAVGRLVGDELALGAKASFEAWDFDEAQRRASVAVRAAPNNPIAWREKAFIHFLEQEFDQALAAFSKLESAEDDDLVELATGYDRIKGRARRLSGQQLGELFGEINTKTRSQLAYRMLRNNLARGVPMSEHMPAVKALLHSHNKNLSDLEVDLDVDPADASRLSR
jgi:tetratricopeptide (TPR) repeat protein